MLVPYHENYVHNKKHNCDENIISGLQILDIDKTINISTLCVNTTIDVD